MMSRTALAWVIGLWAAVTWGGRVAIIFDTGSDGWDRLRIGMALGTTVAAILSLILRRWERQAVTAYAVVSVVIWTRSAAVVVTGDNAVGFVVVHLVLAAVSVAIATVAVLTVRRFR